MEEGELLATVQKKKTKNTGTLAKSEIPFPTFLLEEKEAFKVQRLSNVIFHLSPLSHAGT